MAFRLRLALFFSAPLRLCGKVFYENKLTLIVSLSVVCISYAFAVKSRIRFH